MNKKSSGAVGVAMVLSLLGVAGATVGLAWVAGSLGISASAATQIVSAIQAGGLALTIVMAIFEGGVISAILATVRYLIVKKGKALAVA